MPISPHPIKSTNVRFKNTLKDGTPLFIRSLEPGDEAGLNEGFQRLSNQTRYNRFLGIKKKLSQQELSYLCSPDEQNHFALLGYTDEQGIGVARCVRDKHQPDIAELAVTIIDPFQNKGAGTALFQRLVSMVEQVGITRFKGYSFFENRAVMAFLNRYNARSTPIGEGVIEIDIPFG